MATQVGSCQDSCCQAGCGWRPQRPWLPCSAGRLGGFSPEGLVWAAAYAPASIPARLMPTARAGGPLILGSKPPYTLLGVLSEATQDKLCSTGRTSLAFWGSIAHFRPWIDNQLSKLR